MDQSYTSQTTLLVYIALCFRVIVCTPFYCPYTSWCSAAAI